MVIDPAREPGLELVIVSLFGDSFELGKCLKKEKERGRSDLFRSFRAFSMSVPFQKLAFCHSFQLTIVVI